MPVSSAVIERNLKSPPLRRRLIFVDKRGQLSCNDDEKENKQVDSREDPCDAFFETLRTMCCCFVDDANATQYLKGKPTEDSDETPKLLGDIHPDDSGKNCLVLDLDETLVHSSFRPVPNADFVIPVQVRMSLQLSSFVRNVDSHRSNFCFTC